MHIGVTGPRKLTPTQREKAVMELMQLLPPGTTLHAGDATGLDALARESAEPFVRNEALPAEERRNECRKQGN